MTVASSAFALWDSSASGTFRTSRDVRRAHQSGSPPTTLFIAAGFRRGVMHLTVRRGSGFHDGIRMSAIGGMCIHLRQGD